MPDTKIEVDKDFIISLAKRGDEHRRAIEQLMKEVVVLKNKITTKEVFDKWMKIGKSLGEIM